jgi:branched-chain amino acid transport system permease protein
VKPSTDRSLLGWVGVLGLLVVGWWGLGAIGASFVGLLVVTLYYALAGGSFTFLYGTVGAFSLAQPVFLAVGGYTAVYLTKTYGISPWVSLVLAPAFAALLALPLGFMCIRVGPSLLVSALVTLIVAQAAIPVLVEIPAIGGAAGLYAHVLDDPGFWDMQFLDAVTFARLFLVLNVVFLAFLLLWRRSRLGFAVAAMRDNAEASAAVGVPNTRTYIAVFALAAAIAAPAGVVFAQYNLIATPTLFLGPGSLFQVALVGLVGGTARTWGALAGAVLVVWLPSFVADLAPEAGFSQLTFALLFVAVALFLPRGVSGTWARLVEARERGRERARAWQAARRESPDEAQARS